MITCQETGRELTSGEVFAAGRRNDPKSFPLSPEALKRIPSRHRKKVEETYKTGGINIYAASIAGTNGDSRHILEEFLFSVPFKHVERLLPQTCKNFNFPGRELQCM